jgi:site-specific recombinase XerD
MAAMPRKLPPFLHREITRHRKPVWYFRRGKGPRIRLPGEFNSVEFNVAYDAALNGARPAHPGHAQGTFSWGLSLYRQSHA